MAEIRAIHTPVVPLARMAPIIGKKRYAALQEVASLGRDELGDTTVWNVNSTAAGGGVAEMLRVLVGYTLDAGLDVRWCVISADSDFFEITKRLHNQLHGFQGDGKLGPADQERYTAVTDELGAELADHVRPGDVVLLHDPQTAGMAARLAAAGVHVVWRCHIGTDVDNSWRQAAWSFLRPHLELCQGFVFSRGSYVPDWLDDHAVVIIPPSIDPFSAKNRELSGAEVATVLRTIGLIGGDGGSGRRPPLGSPARAVSRQATIVGEGGPLDPSTPLVVQVSRWDRLKDMKGVMDGFAGEVAGQVDAHLALVGPATDGVSDDPEGAEVHSECVDAWRELPAATRRWVSLVSLPMDDLDENATMVNAIQRHATVVVQKSLAEGFGLTVAEAMWKSRAVVGSAVGGIVDQIVPGTGLLVEDPEDLDAFGRTLRQLLENPKEVEALGAGARRRVLEAFLGDQHLAAYARLMGDLHLRPH